MLDMNLDGVSQLNEKGKVIEQVTTICFPISVTAKARLR